MTRLQLVAELLEKEKTRLSIGERLSSELQSKFTQDNSRNYLIHQFAWVRDELDRLDQEAKRTGHEHWRKLPMISKGQQPQSQRRDPKRLGELRRSILQAASERSYPREVTSAVMDMYQKQCQTDPETLTVYHDDRAYLMNLLKLPYGVRTSDLGGVSPVSWETRMHAAGQVIDSSHAGMRDIRRRVTELVASHLVKTNLPVAVSTDVKPEDAVFDAYLSSPAGIAAGGASAVVPTPSGPKTPKQLLGEMLDAQMSNIKAHPSEREEIAKGLVKTAEARTEISLLVKQALRSLEALVGPSLMDGRFHLPIEAGSGIKLREIMPAHGQIPPAVLQAASRYRESVFPSVDYQWIKFLRDVHAEEENDEVDPSKLMALKASFSKLPDVRVIGGRFEVDANSSTYLETVFRRAPGVVEEAQRRLQARQAAASEGETPLLVGRAQTDLEVDRMFAERRLGADMDFAVFLRTFDFGPFSSPALPLLLSEANIGSIFKLLRQTRQDLLNFETSTEVRAAEKSRIEAELQSLKRIKESLSVDDHASSPAPSSASTTASTSESEQSEHTGRRKRGASSRSSRSSSVLSSEDTHLKLDSRIAALEQALKLVTALPECRATADGRIPPDFLAAALSDDDFERMLGKLVEVFTQILNHPSVNLNKSASAAHSKLPPAVSRFLESQSAASSSKQIPTKTAEEMARELSKSLDDGRSVANDYKVLCLAGPPGVGKTSVARSMAAALGKKFHRISLAGLTDCAELRGHRRTYLGALPGRITEALLQLGCEDGLVLLDEVDKLGRDHRGDPANVLLELFDPQQASRFTDHYLGVPLDVSKLLFVCTANDLDALHPAIADRLEVIQLHSYVREEKVDILKQHLLPKALKAHGLPAGSITLSPEAEVALIDGWTREAGVRGLAGQVDKLVRRLLVKNVQDIGSVVAAAAARQASIVKGDVAAAEAAAPAVSPLVVAAADLAGLLGPPTHLKNTPFENETSLPVGCVRGLAWTRLGGSTLAVEVAKLPPTAATTSKKSAKKTEESDSDSDDESHSHGVGGLKVTGSLGNVMQESSQIALSFAKIFLQELQQVDPATKSASLAALKSLQTSTLHLHVPEGATPKDGPSAGVTMATALVSLATGRPVRGDVAMTGELTLTGRVLKIGGVREKVVAAHKEGVKLVILPEANRADAEEDVPQSIRDEVQIVYASTFADVAKVAFVEPFTM